MQPTSYPNRTQAERTRVDLHGLSARPDLEGSGSPRGPHRSRRRGFKTGGGRGSTSPGGSIPLSYRLPLREIVVDEMPVWQVVRHAPPLSSSALDREDGVDHPSRMEDLLYVLPTRSLGDRSHRLPRLHSSPEDCLRLLTDSPTVNADGRFALALANGAVLDELLISFKGKTTFRPSGVQFKTQWHATSV